jgi:hypothetical protein
MWIWKQLANGAAALVNGDGSKTALMIDAAGTGALKYVDVTLTAAQVKALNATPQQLVPAPGAGFANIFQGAVLFMPYAAAAYTVPAGSDLSFKYTNGAGLEVGQVETTGFLNQTANQTRWARPHAAASGDNSINPTANAAIVLHMLSAEVTVGDSPLKLRVYYRTIPTTL